ncbi:hypothetical protein G3A43_09015 [Paraburkholderia aspalathi]|nr:hypothetical protein [Paraburkholderia aspalathi]MBK3780399.1 hypothetical protein [Paraburkholderia aspalathi]
MTYSCTDFADSIQDKLTDVGALHEADKCSEGYNEDPGAQATASLNAIDRLVEVRDSVIDYRAELTAFAERAGISLDDGILSKLSNADARVQAALAEVKAPVK